MEFFDVSPKNAVERLTTMLQHYPAAVTINGKAVKTSPFPDVGFVDRRVWHGFTNSVQQVPTTPASSPRCFNAYTAGVLCQIPHLDLLPHTYLSEYPSSYPHWNHVARYVITPVANLDLKTLARCIYDDSFIEFDTEMQEVQQQLQHHAQSQARRTIEACKLPEPTNRTAWIRSIENTMDELNSPNFTSMPITSNGKLFTPSTMENQAEMVSALESLSRSNAGLVPVTSFYQMVNPGHQPTGCAMSLQFQHADDEHHALVLTDLMPNHQENTYTIAPMLHASGSYPDSVFIRLAPHADFTEDELTHTLYRCYRQDLANTLKLPLCRVKPWQSTSQQLIVHMRNYARKLLINIHNPHNVVNTELHH